MTPSQSGSPPPDPATTQESVAPQSDATMRLNAPHRYWQRASSMTALLVLLILTVFVVPVVFPAGRAAHVVEDASLSLILLAGAVAVYDRRPWAIAAALLCVGAAASRWLEFLVATDLLPIVREGSGLTAVLLLLGIVAMRVFSDGIVTADRIMGAVALYMLLGIAWAVAYEIVSLYTNGAFAGGNVVATGPARWLYFSFVTLTTVGYGDITPVAPAARSLAALEALTGQLYPAVILARLVSLHAK